MGNAEQGQLGRWQHNLDYVIWPNFNYLLFLGQNYGEILPPWRPQRHRDLPKTRPNPCQGALKPKIWRALSLDIPLLLQSKYGGFVEVWAGSYNTVALAKSGEVIFSKSDNCTHFQWYITLEILGSSVWAQQLQPARCSRGNGSVQCWYTGLMSFLFCRVWPSTCR